MELQQLQSIYETYIAECTNVIENASPTDGLFGMGSDPRKDPCHTRFYENVDQWVQAFLKENPDEEGAYQAVRWILNAPADHIGEPVYWFMFAAHGHCRALIPLLSREHCAELRELYDDRYPKRERMPVQAEIYKLLRRGSGKR